MKKNKNLKKTVWLYAVILFTSAFIVLLLTYYSQIKIDKNINEYLNRISDEEKKKLFFQSGLNTANEENKVLKKDLDKLKKEFDKIKKREKDYKNELNSIRSDFLDTMNSYDNLLTAEKQFNDGNVLSSADILLNQCDYNSLNSIGKEKYNRISVEIFKQASRLLYIQGSQYYYEKAYISAIKCFEESIKYSDDSFITDDCYYYAAYAYLKINNKQKAIELFEMIISKYQTSSYKEDVEYLLKSIK